MVKDKDTGTLSRRDTKLFISECTSTILYISFHLFTFKPYYFQVWIPKI